MRAIRMIYLAGGIACQPLAVVTYLAQGLWPALVVSVGGLVAIAAARGLARVS